MKKKLSLLLGAILIVSVGFLIHSCSKDSIFSDKSDYTAVPSDLLTTVKNWHTAQTEISGTLSISISKGNKAYVLPPTWKEAQLHQQSDGISVIIVPSPDAGIDPNSTLGLVRKFVFTVQNDKVTAGRIIEMFSSKVSIENSKYTLIEDYADGKINKFTGGVISYDVNYNRLSSEVYKNGVKVSNQQAKVSSMSIESFNKKFGTTGKTRLGSTITTLDDCYYLIYYEYELEWPYNITYWEILGYYCGLPDNEAGGGGGGGSGGSGTTVGDPIGGTPTTGPGQHGLPDAELRPPQNTTDTQVGNMCVFKVMEWVSKYIGSNLSAGDILNQWLVDNPNAYFTEYVNGVYQNTPVDLSFIIARGLPSNYVLDLIGQYFYYNQNMSVSAAIDDFHPVMAAFFIEINKSHQVMITGYNDDGTYTYFDPALGTYFCRPASDFFDIVPITYSKDN